MRNLERIITNPTRLLALGIIAAGLAAPAFAYEEQRSFTSDRLTVHNMIGEIRIESGGSQFEVVVNVEGAGANRGAVRLQAGEDELQILFPEGRSDYVYPKMGAGSDANFRIDGDDWLSGMSGGRERIHVSGSGSGLELWADVTIRVPKGHRLTVKHGVGSVSADGVDGELKIATRSGDVRAERTYGELSVATGSGSVTLAQVNGGDVAVATGSGDVEANGIDGDDINVATGSGDIALRTVRGRELQAATGSGEVEAREVSADSVEIGTGSGDIELTLPGAAAADIRAETDQGRIQVELAGQPTYRVREKDEIDMTIGGGGARVRLGSGSGDIRIAE